MDPHFVQGLHALLVQSTSNDTNQLKTATARLNTEYYKNPACISALASILASSPELAVRQLAAVEMRKRVQQRSGDLWTQLPQDERQQIKQKLPELILNEQGKLVRHAAARVVAAIASIEIPLGTWPELLPLLHQACLSTQVAHREVEQTQNFFSLFSGLMVDPESIEVRITTVRALGVIAQYIDTEDKADIKSFQALIPKMIQVLGQALETSDEANCQDNSDLLSLQEIPLLSPHIKDLAAFLLQCGGNRNLSSELRVLALNALNWTIQYKKSKIQSQNLAAVILEGLMPITTEPEPEDSDEDAPCRSALRIIDGLATNLPPTQVFPALRTLIQQYFTSPDPNCRRGAMLALGYHESSVRKATCVAVSCLCEWLEEDCAAKHGTLIPVSISYPHTQRSACTALDALLEILQDSIDQYLGLIMEQLASLLDTAPIPVKTVSKFLPLQHFLVLGGEGEEGELRGIAMDAVGTFAEAVGADVFRPYFADLMKQAFQGLEMGSPRLRECSFLFFSVMARVFGESFAPYLPQVVPALLASCKQSEHGEEKDSEVYVTPLSADVAAFASGSSASSPIAVLDLDGNIEAEMEDVDVDKMLEVNSAIAVEKEIAADTIGALFLATRGHFLPYVEQCVVELVSLLTHYYEGIRKSSTESLLEIVRIFYELSEPQEWQPGATCNVDRSSATTGQELVGHILPPLMDMYETEDNNFTYPGQVVASLCVGLADTINKLGPAFVENSRILTKTKTEEAPEDQAEYDSVLVSSAGDLVSAFANALGADFAQLFKRSAIGCLAEIIAGMKNAVTPSTEPLMELFYKALGDPEAEVQSNAAFAVGLLVEHSEVDLSPQYPLLLHCPPPHLRLFRQMLPASRLNARDNAAGAVSRLIVRNTAAVPLDQVLPVLIAALPLKNDYLENRPVFRALFHLFRSNPQSLGPYLDHLLAVFAHVLDPNIPDQIGEDARAELIQLIGFLNTQEPAKVRAAGLNVFLPGA
ncbi:ARM repeat-containing protein [Pisolithus croceorrhizus]|nr:ARM repeat-containing protein [Pisolithus croceorrhizus]